LKSVLIFGLTLKEVSRLIVTQIQDYRFPMF